MAPKARARLVDVAERLDLAPSTVSRALAGSASVSNETRARVKRVARELGYTPNPVASGLKSGQTFNIGLIAVMNHWYTSAVTSGADRVAAERGYDFVMMNSGGSHDESILLERARRLGSRVDGAIIVDVNPEGGVLDRLIEAVAVPVVLMGCESVGVSSVLVDNIAVGATAARHLRGLGHRSAVVLAARNPTPSAIDNGLTRAVGFIGAMGAGADVTTVVVSPDDPAARQQVIITETARATAVFCASDALAIETVALLRRAGREVPESVSVVGVDDHPLSAPLGLTTVAQTPEGMGEIATRLLLEAIREDPEPRSVTIGTELVVRDTTAMVTG